MSSIYAVSKSYILSRTFSVRARNVAGDASHSAEAIFSATSSKLGLYFGSLCGRNYSLTRLSAYYSNIFCGPNKRKYFFSVNQLIYELSGYYIQSSENTPDWMTINFICDNICRSVP